ncbi:hypothetical protein ABRY23_10820 [Melioribacteraceae bacterium 4301-Me]|uniref:hypothetical protein n=1 Tax=Pyranulibacter aquaticus TaxID=3163344 RepID=UPI0035965477
MSKKLLFTTWLLPILFFTNCSSSIDIQSNWLNEKITLNSDNPNWQKGLKKLDDKPIYLNTLNDNEFIYVYLTTTDPLYERQIFMRGLTIWFDSTGGDSKIFGIAYPIGLKDGEFMRQQFDQNKQDMPSHEELTNESLKELEIIGPMQNQRFRTSPDGSKGIEAKIEKRDGNFIYMLKVPLFKSPEHYFAIGTRAGKPLGMGVELNKPNSRDFPTFGMGTFRPPEGMMQPNEGQRGRRSFRGIQSRNSVRELDVWCNITLAK